MTSLNGRHSTPPTPSALHRVRTSSSRMVMESDGSTNTSENEAEGRQSQAGSGGGKLRSGRESGRRSPIHTSILQRRLLLQCERQKNTSEQQAKVKRCLAEMQLALKNGEKHFGGSVSSSFSLLFLVFVVACFVSLAVQLLLPSFFRLVGEPQYGVTPGGSTASLFPV